MFIQGRPIKTCQCEFIPGEMCRDPIKQDPNTMLVAVIHEITEIIGVTKTAGGSKIAGGLIAP